MKFRQIHLDFHTSPDIEKVGKGFNREQWQRALKKAHVDSITLFASCHHGYSYYPTEVGEKHPHLDFNLLREEMDACHEIGVKTPVYLSGISNSYAASRHLDWSYVPANGKIYDPLVGHFYALCFNTPYLDYLCDEIREVMVQFPDADGIFIDIIAPMPCCCPTCMREMVRLGMDPLKEEDRQKHGLIVLRKYYEAVRKTIQDINPDMPIFHNSGHVFIDSQELLKFYSHLELESLPTGGWGYDHFPFSAAYCRNLPFDFLGMTGKFHTTWGEFGGYKHPNALRYECMAMIANGAHCSIGDQLHPSGELDETLYEAIGKAYGEVEAKEPWCEHASSAANLAVVSALIGQEPFARRSCPEDEGVARLLLEEHIPFDVVDSQMDWNRYRFLILPDKVILNEKTARKLVAFREQGGKVILSAVAGTREDGSFALDMPFASFGRNPYSPDYVLPEPDYRPDYVGQPMLMAMEAWQIRRTSGKSLGKVFNPYFNRTWEHFCSHRQAPPQEEPSGYDAGVMTEDLLYFAHPVFTIYRAMGMVAERQYVAKAIKDFMGNELDVQVSGLPSQGRLTWMRQPQHNRYVLHVLYANTILRGGPVELSGGTTVGRATIELIEDLNPCGPVTVSVKVPEAVRSVALVPERQELSWRLEGGRVVFQVSAFSCHCMIELTY